MTGAAVVALHNRPFTRLFRIAGWVSLPLIVIFDLNSMVLYLRAH